MRKLLVFLALLSCLIVPPSAAEKPPPKIVVARLDADQVAELREVAPRARIVSVASAEEALKEIRDANALVGVLNAELVREGKNLEWIQVYSAGVDRYRFPELIESDIVFTNAKVIQGPNVADQAMALLLVLTRRMHEAVRQHDRGQWNRAPFREEGSRPIELDGKIALVVGLGGIGKQIARRAHGFGMTVAGIDPKVEPVPPYVDSIYPPGRLHEMLGKADVVFVAVPLTPKTEKMIGAAALSSIKKGAYLVNIARGKVIDTDAMVAAVRDGRLAGVGLDVTDPEPLPNGHPLWSLDNVIVTPHLGGTSDKVWARRMKLLKDNVRRFVAGEPLENVVDKKAGY